MAVAHSTLTQQDVESAAGLIAGRVRETPVVTAGELSRRVGARVLLKAENLQLTGSFKPRGATNTLARLRQD
jgi:threonine dehydratase